MIDLDGKYSIPGIPNSQFSYGCFNWMIPNQAKKNGWKSPNIHLKNVV